MTDIFLEDEEPAKPVDPNKLGAESKNKLSRKRKIAIIILSIIMIYFFGSFTISLLSQQSNQNHIVTINHTITDSTFTCTLVQITNGNHTYYEPYIQQSVTTSYYYNTSTNRYNQTGIVISITNSAVTPC